MRKVIKGTELKGFHIDLVCSSCGREHNEAQYIEGRDFVFEIDTETNEESCICMPCKIKFDGPMN